MNKFLQYFRACTRFKKEFRRQIRSFIIITLAFTVAFSWRQTTFDLSQYLISLVITIQNPATSTIITSTFITLFSVFLIYLTAHFLKEVPNEFF